jgi:very-short-patch-repair endonuclease
MTPAEKFLWSKIRNKQLNNCWFYTQKPIGIYIVDFYCHKARLVIVVDGEQHQAPDSIEYDKSKDEYLKNLGLRTLRFTNAQVLTNVTAVLEQIKNKLNEHSDTDFRQSYSPLHKGRAREGIK